MSGRHDRGDLRKIFDLMRIAISYLIRMVKYYPVCKKYLTKTMIGRLAYIENLALASLVLSEEEKSLIDGAIVECGTWKGGMSAGLIEMGGPDRHYCFFDSFEGLPPAEDIDGDRAKRWQSNITSSTYYDNCSASLDEFEQTIKMAGCARHMIDVRVGFFEDTFPQFASPPIAVLRLDADWYSPTMACFRKFWDYVLPGGIILIDDYFTWEGCARAVHDFLSERKAIERIHQGPLGRVAYIRKMPQDDAHLVPR